MQTLQRYDWHKCKSILCIRADNMGDLLMSSPAIRALRESFHCKITMLTSTMGSKIAPFIPYIDEVVVFDLPWVKCEHPIAPEAYNNVLENVKRKSFDAAVIFTVYSQSPLPAAMLAYSAGIPRVLAWCRENPYSLISDWQPDKEPYHCIHHQVKRDLLLVNAVGATASDDKLAIRYSNAAKKSMREKCEAAGISMNEKYIVFHPGVSEDKREYPLDLWIAAGKKIVADSGYKIVVTGATGDVPEASALVSGIGPMAASLAGVLSIEELIAFIAESPLLVSVNTGTAHIAAATQTPVVVLYALTNPQHTPWKVLSSVLYFSVAEKLRSSNQVVAHVQTELSKEHIPYPSADEIIIEVKRLLQTL